MASGQMMTRRHVEALLAAWDAARIGFIQRARKAAAASTAPGSTSESDPNK